jgi:predicted nucleic acid-binding Zn ribbon protein
MTYKIIYDKARFPKKQRRLDGTYGCRGCGKDIPKGRESWCSSECYNLYEPSRVINAVKLHKQRTKDWHGQRKIRVLP